MTPQLREKKNPALRVGGKHINIQRQEATDKHFPCSLFKMLFNPSIGIKMMQKLSQDVMPQLLMCLYSISSENNMYSAGCLRSEVCVLKTRNYNSFESDSQLVKNQSLGIVGQAGQHPRRSVF